jgi:hypothetical protein
MQELRQSRGDEKERIIALESAGTIRIPQVAYNASWPKSTKMLVFSHRIVFPAGFESLSKGGNAVPAA